MVQFFHNVNEAMNNIIYNTPVIIIIIARALILWREQNIIKVILEYCSPLIDWCYHAIMQSGTVYNYS